MRRGVFLGIAIALSLVSCAGPTELARRSEVSLQAGDLRKAYDLARNALDKDRGNARARAAYDAAAQRLYDDTHRRFGLVAGVDTIAAARYAIDLAEFRAEMVTYHASLTEDPAFADQMLRVRQGAAGIF